ncbi:MAG: hypothetical protein LBM67_09020 [Lentimicrobiaceae bacterium]|jgi:lipopolysaccharide export system protein LptA|nr:hypothetical protein [Lentimicrobiaceae bacterium]
MKKILLAFVLLFPATFCFGQKTIIYVEKAHKADYNTTLGKDIQRLIGDVVIRHDSTLFYCDSAYLNEVTKNFDAFSNVHINVNDSVDIYSDKLRYTGKTRVAELFDNVRLVDDSTTLYTEYLIYYRNLNLANYPNEGLIISGDKHLKSKKGYYRADLKEFYFRQDVVMSSPKDTLYTDTLVYNNRTEIATIVGPSIIRADNNTIYGNYGWYNTVSDRFFLNKRATIVGLEQSMSSDSVYYDRMIGFGESMGNVEIKDTVNQIILTGHYAQMWEEIGKSFVTDSAIATTYDNVDTLFLHADTLFMYFDKDHNAKEMFAYQSVRFFRTDLQGVCDSLIYTMIDTTIRMRKDPVLWSNGNQLSADSIDIAIRNQQVDSMTMYNAAFIIVRDTIEGFNQVKGKNMVAFFHDNDLYLVNADGNSQTVYWMREDDGNLIGVNFAESSTMSINVDKNQIAGIRYFSAPKEVTIPEKDLGTVEKELKGFIWRDAIRPTDKHDIFRHIEKQVEGDSSSRKTKNRKE